MQIEPGPMPTFIISTPRFIKNFAASAVAILPAINVNDIIEKTRYHIIVEEKQWDVDQFHGNNAGLWVAEVELISEDEQITLPKWVTNEVTGDEHYYNAFISKHPYNTWKK